LHTGFWISRYPTGLGWVLCEKYEVGVVEAMDVVPVTKCTSCSLHVQK
jgi:hypothetical protein